VQNAHDQVVTIPALTEIRFAQAGFMDESGLFVGADSAQVFSIDPQEYAVQVQGSESMLQQELHHFRSVALVPAGFVPDKEANFSGAGAPVDVKNATISDQTPAIPIFDLNPERLFLRRTLEHILEPLFLGGLRDGQRHGKIAPDLWIIQPFDKLRQIAALIAAQADAFPIKHKNLHRNRITGWEVIGIILSLTSRVGGYKMVQCSFVLMFHKLCYTHNKMKTDSSPEGRASWPTWAGFLRRHGLESLAAWVLEAAGPLTVLGAQALYLGGPLLRPAISNGQIEALAGLLEDHNELLAFTALLREEMA
jgi:hypothetical protein